MDYHDTIRSMEMNNLIISDILKQELDMHVELSRYYAEMAEFFRKRIFEISYAYAIQLKKERDEI